METTPLINTLCYKLPGDISRAVYNEYNSRWDDIKKIWDYSQNRYKALQDYQQAVMLLLALSTFYRRVLSGFDGARDFYKTITKNRDRSIDFAIAIGKYKLDKKEYNKLLSIQIAFEQFVKKYGIGDSFFEYTETDEFLSNCYDLFIADGIRSDNKSGNSNPNTDDLPF